MLHASHKRIIYRHIAWLYSLRSQLLIPTPWEHINQSKSIQIQTKLRMRKVGVGLVDDVVTGEELREHLPADEYERLINANNTATQIIDLQSQELKELRKANLINDFPPAEAPNKLPNIINGKTVFTKISMNLPSKPLLLFTIMS